MKTLVEFFDSNQIENTNAALRYKPDKIIFIGYRNSFSKRKLVAIDRFFRLRDMDVSLEYITVPQYDYEEIVNSLKKVVAENEGCYFDLTGGKELVLVAAGNVAAESGIPMFYFNINTGGMIKVKNCDKLPDTEAPALSIREIITLNGGSVIYDLPEDYKWNITPSFKKDVETMWNICRQNCGLWNKQMLAFESFVKFGTLANDFSLAVDLNVLKNHNEDAFLNRHIIDLLVKKGLLLDYCVFSNDGNESLSFRFKNEQVYKCLTKAGNILELYTYEILKEIQEESPGYYDDIDVGVYVDWDGDIKPEGTPDTKNEIDIILMKDEIPVFISCKNGAVRKEALYELNTVAEHFGCKNYKKILIATYTDRDSENESYLIQRATDMGIIAIKDIHKLDREQYKAKLKSNTK